MQLREISGQVHQQKTGELGGVRITFLRGPKSETLRESVLGALRRWHYESVLRLVLREVRSMGYRIWLSRCTPTVLNFAEVRQSLPLVSCSDSRNEMQFCSASIQMLSVERPYLTLADMRLVLAGFFLAEKWFLHMGMRCQSEQQKS